jgi:protein-L-isoaspartate(D-aspartate) O-methyltransferase
MVDVAMQRQNMVESQVMTSDVTDRRIIQAMLRLPRERFVPAPMSALAYIDEPVAISGSAGASGRRWLLAPRALGKLLQLADVNEGGRVLDVGCGTGYATAILGAMAGSVVGLECSEELAEAARTNLAALAITNVSIVVGDLPGGCPDKAPFDVIFIGGAIAIEPDRLFSQLKDGGRLVAITLQEGLGRATVWRRLGRSFDSRVAFDASAAILPGFDKAVEFVL